MEPVKRMVEVKLTLDSDVNWQDVQSLMEKHGAKADLKGLLYVDYEDEESPVIAFGEYGFLDEDASAKFVDDIESIRACRIVRTAAEADGGCVLSLESIDHEATRRKQRTADGINLSSDGTKLISVPCEIDSIDIPRTVRKIGDHAFAHCENLSEIVIPGTVEEIGCQAFERCKNLRKVVIQPGCRHIGRSAFLNCRDLTEVILPDTVTTIEAYAFAECGNLARVKMPRHLEAFGFNVFESCPLLENRLILSEDGKQLLFYKSDATEVVVPDGVEEIADEVFASCLKLRVLELPGSVYCLGDDCLPSWLKELRLARKLDLRHSGLGKETKVTYCSGNERNGTAERSETDEARESRTKRPVKEGSQEKIMEPKEIKDYRLALPPYKYVSLDEEMPVLDEGHGKCIFAGCRTTDVVENKNPALPSSLGLYLELRYEDKTKLIVSSCLLPALFYGFVAGFTKDGQCGRIGDKRIVAYLGKMGAMLETTVWPGFVADLPSDEEADMIMERYAIPRSLIEPERKGIEEAWMRIWKKEGKICMMKDGTLLIERLVPPYFRSNIKFHASELAEMMP